MTLVTLADPAAASNGHAYDVSFDDVVHALADRGLVDERQLGSDSIMARCPSHSDRTASLHVSEAHNGRDLCHCHAGCDREHILRDLGLWRDQYTSLLGPQRGVERLREVNDVGWGRALQTVECCWRRAEAIGVEDESESFACVIPEHEHRARVVSAFGVSRYRCETMPEQMSLSFAEVFRWRTTGGPCLMDGPMSCRWYERLEHAAKNLEPTPVAVPTPIRCSPVSRIVAGYIRLYLGLRDASGGGYGLGRPFTFTRSFCTSYCGVTAKQARIAMFELERGGSIRRVGTVPVDRYEAILWQVGS